VRAPRMSIRRWMVAVALLSISLTGYLEVKRLKRRRDEYLARAAREEFIAQYFRRRRGPGGSTASEVYHASRARRYAAKASRPWIPDAPDAPKPK
jgi:hypothetical protein